MSEPNAKAEAQAARWLAQNELFDIDDLLVEAMSKIVYCDESDNLFNTLQQARREISNELAQLAYHLRKA